MNYRLSNLLLCVFITASGFSQNTETVESLQEYITISSNDIPEHPEYTAEQKSLYKKHHLEKVKSEQSLLQKNDLLLSGPVYDYVNTIFTRIITSNSQISQTSKLVIYRTNTFNAFTMGDDVVFFNVGILVDLKSESEIALVLAHELAHNVLGHVEKALEAQVLLETDEGLEDELHVAVKKEYGNVTALNEVMIPRILESKATSQKNEFEADNMGALFCQEAGFSLSSGIGMFQAMDYHSAKSGKSIDLSALPIDFQALFAKKTANYSRTGSLGTFQNNDDLEPYLRSHPYDKDRFDRLALAYGVTTSLESINRNSDISFIQIHQSIVQLAIEVAYQEHSFSEGMFIEINNYKNYGSQFDYERGLSSLFYILSFLKERRLAGSALQLQNPEQPEDFDRVCCFGQNLSPNDCNLLGNMFAPKPEMNAQNLGFLDQLVVMIDLAKTERKDDLKIFWQLYFKELRASNYSWILQDMEDYLYNVKGYTFVKTVK